VAEALFALVCTYLAFSHGTLAVSLLWPRWRFWPPPDPPSWRRTLMLKTSWLGPASVIGLLALAFLDRGSLGLAPQVRFVAGGLLFAPGAVLAVWGALGLGFESSTGVAGELAAKGAYRLSRNPQYVGGVGAFTGYALLWSSQLALVVAAIWSAWFLLAPFAEEPWLRTKLGAPYGAYTRRVRRYL